MIIVIQNILLERYQIYTLKSEHHVSVSLIDKMSQCSNLFSPYLVSMNQSECEVGRSFAGQGHVVPLR